MVAIAPLVAVALMLALFPGRGHRVYLGYALAFYVLAKLAEAGTPGYSRPRTAR